MSIKLSTEEQLIVDEYNKVNENYNTVSRGLEDVFLHGVKKYTDEKDFAGAKEYLRLIPDDSLAKIFVADHIRNARGDYDKS